MKKLLFIFAILLSSYEIVRSQANFLTTAPNGLATTQVRAPNGLATSAYMRACALVLPSELTGLPPASTLSLFGFTMTTGTGGTPVAGNFTVYLQNTTDVSYTKGTSWPTIITGMTSVYASVMTIPQSAGTNSIILTLSTPFVFTGGGIYVAYDWDSSGPYASTPATYLSESIALNPGCVSASSSSVPPTTFATTAFRPNFLFGMPNPYTNDVQILGVEALGSIPATFNTPHTINTLVKNGSSGPLTNFSVNLNVVGANPFVNTQVVSSLAAGATTLVSFAPFNPTNGGAQTVSVSVPSDQNNANNAGTYSQSVTCSTWGRNPASGTFTYNSVGFGAGSGIISNSYLNPITSTLTGLRIAISTNTAGVGNSVYGVLMNAIGAIVATTNTLMISGGVLGTFQTFTFTSPPGLTAATNYYFGLAQMTTVNTFSYYPAGTQYSAYLPPNIYFSTGLGGGPPAVVNANFGYFGMEGIFGHTLTITAASQSLTCGSTATLNAVSPSNYSWSTGATTSSIIVSPTVSTGYSVSTTNTLGCYAFTNVSVNVTPIAVIASASPSVSCAGELVTLAASGGANSYTWTSIAGPTISSTFNVAPLVPTTYTLLGEDLMSGCSSSTVLALVVNPLPVVNISSSSPSVCLGNAVTLFAGGTATLYTWSTSQTGPGIAVNPTATTVYTVTGTNAAGCTKTSSISVSVDSFTPGISNPTTVCQGKEVTLTASGAAILIWSNTSVFPSITVTPAITTVYSVSGTGANGCMGTNATTVTVNPNPTITAAASNASFCRFETSTLTVSGAPNYSWSSGQTSSMVVISPTPAIFHSYTVTGTNSLNCTHSVVVTIKVNTCTGITTHAAESSFQVYPNPCVGLVTLNYPAFTEQSRVEIFDVLGNKVYQRTISSETTQIDISGQAAGLYFIQVQGGESSSQLFKIVKQ